MLIDRPRRRTISLTALIDVVFILLMFFMLTSSFTRWRAVDFNSLTAGQESSAEQAQLLILKEDGSLQLHSGTLALDHFEELEQRHLQQLRPDKALVILPEANSTVQTIVATMEKLKNIGLIQVTLGKVLPSPTQE